MAKGKRKSNNPTLLDKSQAIQQSVLPLDTDNPLSAFNIVTEVVRNYIHEAVEKRPDLFTLDERELRRVAKPTPTDNLIRLNFWKEYHRTLANKDDLKENGRLPEFKIGTVFQGIISAEYFYGYWVRSPERIAWLMCPPASYEASLEEALEHGVKRLRELLDIDFFNPNGTVNPKAAEVVLKAYALIDMRVKGAHIQRIEQKSLNITAHPKDVAELVELSNMEEIHKRLKLLEAREKAVMGQLEAKGIPDPVINVPEPLHVEHQVLDAQEESTN